MVGRSDVSLNEAPHRCRMAIHNTDLALAGDQARITILLSPSDLPKRGTHFDLAIALAVLKADGQLPAADLAGIGLHRRADPQRRPAVGARRAADGAGGRSARASAGSSSPSRRRTRRRWCPA